MLKKKTSKIPLRARSNSLVYETEKVKKKTFHETSKGSKGSEGFNTCVLSFNQFVPVRVKRSLTYRCCHSEWEEGWWQKVNPS